MKSKQLFTVKTCPVSSKGARTQASIRYFFTLLLLVTTMASMPVSGAAAEGYLAFGNPWGGLVRWRDKPSPYSALWHGIDLKDGKAFYEDYMVGQWVDLGYGSAEDSITWRMISPEGNVQDSTLHWIESGGYWMQMRNLQVIEWGPEWSVADGVYSPDEVGLWRFELLHNDEVVHTDQFELIPRTLVKNSDAAPTVIVNEDGSYNHVVLSVKLLDFDGVNPKSGESVSFELTPPKGTKGGNVNPASVTTSADGIASANFVPGSKSGKYIVQASSKSAPTTTQTFSVTVSHGQQDPSEPDEELIDDKNEGEPVDEDLVDVTDELELLEVAGGICPKVGNPINIGNGNKYEKERDFSTRSKFPLTFVRHYNSLADENTPMGAHWRINYDRSITKFKTGKGKKAPWVVEASRHNGKTYQFVQAEDGGWLAEPDVSDQLEETAEGWRYTTRRGLVEIYDATGRLNRLVAPGDREHQLSYDNADRLRQIQDGFGRSIVISYSMDDLIETVTDPAGSVYRYAYDAVGNLASVTYPDSATRQYLYENPDFPHALTGIIDENNQHYATWEYDDAGRAIQSEHAGGVDAVGISFQANGKRSVTDAAGSVSTYQVSSLHGAAKVTQLLKEKCADCGPAFSRQASYDSNGYPKLRIDADGNQTKFYYNDRGLLENETRGFGSGQEHQTNIVWHPEFNLPLAVHEVTFSTYYTYDQDGMLLEKTKKDRETGASRSWTYTYNEMGLIATLDGPRTDVNDVTTYTYYPDGNLASISNPIFTEVTYLSYDAFGRPLEQQDANGTLTEFEYDVRGRLVSRKTAGETTLFQYDNSGNTIGITAPDGQEVKFRYDAAGRLVEQEDGRGNIARFTLDPKGNRIEEVSWNKFATVERQHSWSYDPLGLLVEDHGSRGQTTSFDYDSSGRLVSTTDAYSNTTRFSYGALNRRETVTQPDGGVVSNSYDAAGNLIRVTDPLGNSTLYAYNGFGEQIEIQSPDAGTSSSEYDAAGNQVSIQHVDGISVSNQYDGLNRLVQSSYSDGSLVVYTYDDCLNGMGLLCSMSTDNTRVSWQYDVHGRPVEKSQQVGDIMLVTSAEYNAHGQLVRLIYPSGKILSYQYTDDQLTGLMFDGVPVLSGVTYNSSGQVNGWIWGNGAQHTRTYDQDGHLIQYSMGNLDRILSFDMLGNITTMNDAENEQQFTYDEMQRIVSAVAQDFELGLSYDLNGNRLAASESPGVENYSYEAMSNRLAQVSGMRERFYQYDARGNILSDGMQSFEFDARNRLVSMNGDAATYTYNGKGERVAKSQTGVFSYFTYAENGSLLGEYDQTGQVLQETVYINGIPVAVTKPDGLHYIHSDHLGTPRHITDQVNRVVWKWDGKPFGDTPAEEDPDGDGQDFTYNLRFPGQYYDQETGLHYNYFRDYDPTTGRYIESDPIGLEGGLNTYAYVGGNPINLFDPFGLIQVYGNWCGPDWTGGRNGMYDPSLSGVYTSPVDIMDTCCMSHDMQYERCRDQYPCDQKKRRQCQTEANEVLGYCANWVQKNRQFNPPHSALIGIWMNNFPALPEDNNACCR